MKSAEKKKRKRKKEAIDPTIAALLARIEELEFDVDILTETVKVLKKRPRRSCNSVEEQGEGSDHRRPEGEAFTTLLKRLDLSKSSYYYERKRLQLQDKYESVRRKIQEIFKENRSCYGYRRVKAVLAREGLNISEKLVLRLMCRARCSCMLQRTKTCSREAIILASTKSVLICLWLSIER